MAAMYLVPDDFESLTMRSSARGPEFGAWSALIHSPALIQPLDIRVKCPRKGDKHAVGGCLPPVQNARVRQPKRPGTDGEDDLCFLKRLAEEVDRTCWSRLGRWATDEEDIEVARRRRIGVGGNDADVGARACWFQTRRDVEELEVVRFGNEALVAHGCELLDEFSATVPDDLEMRGVVPVSLSSLFFFNVARTQSVRLTSSPRISLI